MDKKELGSKLKASHLASAWTKSALRRPESRGWAKVLIALQSDWRLLVALCIVLSLAHLLRLALRKLPHRRMNGTGLMLVCAAHRQWTRRRSVSMGSRCAHQHAKKVIAKRAGGETKKRVDRI